MQVSEIYRGIPEFFDLELSTALFKKFDELQYWEKILPKVQFDQDECVHIMLGGMILATLCTKPVRVSWAILIRIR